VLAEEPEIARAADGDLGRVLGTRVLQLGGGLVGQLVEQGVDVLAGEADAIEGVLGAELLEDLGQGAVIPLSERRRPVQRDPESRGVGALDVQLDHVGLGPAEGLHRREAPVAGDHATRPGLHDQRLGLAEAAQRRRDRVEVPLCQGSCRLD
jgi:hypothetical protein